MRLRRLAPGLVALSALLASPAAATTAGSLSGRMLADGLLVEYAADEWILDAATAFPERGDDSRWGIDNDVARVAVTWDAARLYLAVDLTAADSGVLVMIANGPGGIVSLDATGEFRRAIDLPFAANLLLLAFPGAEPRVARADATHAFALVDAATVPAVIAANPGGDAGFEAWIPWSLIDPARPLRIVVAVTGATGSGAGDAAPDPAAALASDRGARAILDRWIYLSADGDADGAADAGASPRARATIAPQGAPVAAAGSAGIDVTVDRRVFAPDRGESATFTVRPDAAQFDSYTGRCVVHGMDGREVRTLAIPAGGAAGAITVSWDGRDGAGRVCDGGAYVAAFEIEFVADGSRQRATKRAAVAVVR